MKIERGCTEDVKHIPYRWSIGDLKLKRCPLSIIDKDAFWFIKAYNFLEKGILPNAGGWLNQSNKFIEGMNIVISEINEIAKEKSNAK